MVIVWCARNTKSNSFWNAGFFSLNLQRCVFSYSHFNTAETIYSTLYQYLLKPNESISSFNNTLRVVTTSKELRFVGWSVIVFIKKTFHVWCKSDEHKTNIRSFGTVGPLKVSEIFFTLNNLVFRLIHARLFQT